MNASFDKPFTFDRVVRIIIGLLIAVGLYLLVNKLSAVLLPFLVAWLLAYMIHPIVGVFQHKLKIKNRVVAIVLALTSIAIVSVGVLLLIIPPIINEIIRTSSLLTEYVQQIQSVTFIPEEMKAFLIDGINKIDMEALLNRENISQGVDKIMPQLWALVSGSIDLIINMFVLIIVFLYTVFILIDYEKITGGWKAFVPTKFRSRLSQMLVDLEKGMNKYFRGQAAIASIVGILFAVSFEIIDLPLGMILGLMIGVLTMVPYLKVIMIPPIAFFAFLKSIDSGQSYWMVVIIILAIFVVIQSFEDLVLIPKIMGKAMGMNPAVILLSLSVWGALLGVAGMIIALPMTTIIVSYYQRFVLGDELLFESSKKPTAVKKATVKKPPAKSKTTKK